MSALTSFITEAYEDHLSFLSVNVTIGQDSYIALPAESQFENTLEIGGVSEGSDGMVIIKKSEIDSLPKIGQIMLVDSVPMRISVVNTSAGNPLIGIEYRGQADR